MFQLCSLRTLGVVTLGVASLFLTGCPELKNAGKNIHLTQVGRYHHTDQSPGAWGESAAEIVAFNKASQRLFVVNGDSKSIDILDASDITNPSPLGTLDLSNGGAFSDVGGPNSTATFGDLVVVAVEHDHKQSNGWAYFFTASTGAFISRVECGALPDMATFTPDGSAALIANEGEPSSDYQTDPEGSVSIIRINGGIPAAASETANFHAFNNNYPNGVRVFGNKGHSVLNVSAISNGEETLTVSSTARRASWRLADH